MAEVDAFLDEVATALEDLVANVEAAPGSQLVGSGAGRTVENENAAGGATTTVPILRRVRSVAPERREPTEDWARVVEQARYDANALTREACAAAQTALSRLDELRASLG
jgi:hypothetical protein